MGKIATTLDEQISLLRSRGMIIKDEEKAKEVLLDVGYYRLGFYWFPFETTYPDKNKRSHSFVPGTDFDNAVKLYYFDFELRNILLKYLSRIEINFRTLLIYHASNEYKTSPAWFADPAVMNSSYIASFDSKVYTFKFKQKPTIAQHHRRYKRDKYAPAWKTLEFLTLGNIITIYSSLNNENLKLKIAKQFGIDYVVVFENYINLILNVRNACAHGNILYDFAPIHSIRKGPAMMKKVGENQNLNGALQIVQYLVKQVSKNRYNDFRKELRKLLHKYNKYDAIKQILINTSSLNEDNYKSDCVCKLFAKKLVFSKK